MVFISSIIIISEIKLISDKKIGTVGVWEVFGNRLSYLGNFLQKGIMYAMPVKLDELWKIAAPFGIVEGFDLTPFDDVIIKARSAVDAMVEPHPLWEYPSIVTGDPVVLAEFNFNEPPTHASFKAKIASSM